MGGGGGWGRRRLLFVDVFVDAQIEHQQTPMLDLGGRPWYTEYIEVILLSFNGCLVQVLECSLIHARDVLWSRVFNSHTWHYFWQQILWYFPYGISAESIWTCSMESNVDMPKFYMELTIPWPFHDHSTWNPWCPWNNKLAEASANSDSMDSIWNNPGKVKTLFCQTVLGWFHHQAQVVCHRHEGWEMGYGLTMVCDLL